MPELGSGNIPRLTGLSLGCLAQILQRIDGTPKFASQNIPPISKSYLSYFPIDLLATSP